MTDPPPSQQSGRRFQINPGPLRLRGEIPQADPDAGRCIALVKNGAGRCLRDAVDGPYCRQHAATAMTGKGPTS